MKRLLFVFASLALYASTERRIPTDTDKLNSFAAAYNQYTVELYAGVVDVKQWAKVEAAWHSMAGGK